jgi:putative spermidine/putrescine transport system permease protein
VEFLVLTPTIVPTLAAAMGIHVAFIRYGLSDSLAGVILVHLIPVTPYMTLIMSSVFANYNPEYEEQARTLGAGPLQVFIRITWPAIWPGVLVGSLFAFVISWSQYVLTLMIGGGQVITLPMLLFAFANSGDNPITAALSVVFIAPAVLFLIVTTRYLTGRNAALGGFGKL